MSPKRRSSKPGNLDFPWKYNQRQRKWPAWNKNAAEPSIQRHRDTLQGRSCTNIHHSNHEGHPSVSSTYYPHIQADHLKARNWTHNLPPAPRANWKTITRSQLKKNTNPKKRPGNRFKERTIGCKN
jgi:hypothetical protein